MEITFPGRSLALNFPALFPSNSVYSLEKSKLLFWMRRSGTLLCSTTSHIRASVLLARETGGDSSVSEKCLDEKHEDRVWFVRESGGKGWIHFVGIGGCGLSALAMLALKQGFEVSGSDMVWSSFMDGLLEAGARLHIGHSVSNLKGIWKSRLPDAIVVSSAIPQDNVEILHANSAGVPVYKRDYWLARLTQGFNLIAVSGSHGKSTTASMLAYVLKAMGHDLTAVVGANVPQFPERNIISGCGQNFVLEADEYDGCFLGLSPYLAVVTNLDWEHVDTFQDEEAVKSTFRRFLKQIKVGGHLVISGDSVHLVVCVTRKQGVNGAPAIFIQGLADSIWSRPAACSLLNHRRKATGSEDSDGVISVPDLEPYGNHYRITTYGISSLNDWHVSSVHSNPHGGCDYTLWHREHQVADIRLQLPGFHNVLNSLAVISTVMALFGDTMQFYELIDHLSSHLESFTGVSRRFERIGTIYGCHIYDDYAHHPTEIRAVLQAARQTFPSKAILVVFQPHTYSRLAALKDGFATALSDADQVVVTEVYAARETNVWNVSGRDLAASIIGPPSEYISSLEDVVDKLVLQISRDLHRQIVVLTLGAGDITTVGPKVLHRLQEALQVES